MGFVCKQPNGRYCRFSTITDCPSHWDMTAEEYIEMKVKEASENARKEATEVLEKHLQDFDQIKKWFIPGSMTQREFNKIYTKMSQPIEQGE